MNQEDALTLPAPDYFRVGDFLIRPTLKAVRPFHGFDAPSSAEKDRRLPDKAIAVLMKLAEEPRKVFSREQLLDEVWGQEREAYDRVLDNAISELRRAFGDNAREPRYIETITKQGYRLIAPVEWPSRQTDISLELGRELGGRGEEEGPAGEVDGERAEAGASSLVADDSEAVEADEPSTPGPSSAEREAGESEEVAPGLEQSPVRGPLSDRPMGGDRRLYAFFGFLALVLVLGAVYELLFRGGFVSVALHPMQNSTENPAFDRLAEDLVERLEDSECPNFTLGVRNVAWFSEATVSGSAKRGKGKISLLATVEGRGIEAKEVEVTGGAGADPERLTATFFESIQETLDRSFCEKKPRGSCHCLRVIQRLWQRGRHAELSYLLVVALEASPDDLELLDLAIGLHLRRAEYGSARQRWDQALALTAAQEEAWPLRLEWRGAQIDRDFKAQLAALKALRIAEPKAPRWSLELGRFLLDHHRACEESQAAFDDAQIAGAHEERLPMLARKQAACQEPGLAAKSLEAFLGSHPESALGLTRSAEIHRLAGRYQEAKQKLASALQLVADFPPALLERAHWQLAQGQISRSLDDFDHYGRFATWPEGVHRAAIGRAMALLEAGDSEAAFAEAQAAEEAVKKSAEAAWIRGRVAAAEGRLDDGYLEAEMIKTLAEEEGTRLHLPLYHHLLGVLASAAGDWEAAVDAFYDAVSLQPLDAVFFRMAWIRAFMRVGKPGRAREELEALLDLNGNYGPALCALGDLERQEGDTVSARQFYRRAFSAWSDQPEDLPMQKCRVRLRDLET